VNASSVEYLKDLGELRILSRDESTPRRVSVLQDMHFRNVLQRTFLHRKTEDLARDLVTTLFNLCPKEVNHMARVFTQLGCTYTDVF